MAKAIACKIIFNTKWGYCMQPIQCKSIVSALRKAKESKMAFRIYVGDKVVRSGWYV